MHPQPQALDDAQPGTVQQFDNKLMNSGHHTNDLLRLIPSQDNGNLDLPGRPFGVDFLVQWLLEYMFVEKDQCIQRLVLCRWRNIPITSKERQVRFDLLLSFTQVMTLINSR